jgi:hypothetical protein
MYQKESLASIDTGLYKSTYETLYLLLDHFHTMPLSLGCIVGFRISLQQIHSASLP